MGVNGDGGGGNRIFADFQAKMLLYGKPPEYDPAEEHMRWFLRLVIVWTVLAAVVAAGVLWFTDGDFAAIGVGTATVMALAIGYRLRG